MSRLRIKICGLTRLEDAQAAVDLGADAVGFVLWPGSPRGIDVARATTIARALPAFVTRVGVFVNAAPEAVRRAVEAIGLEVAQLHGDESVDSYESVARRLVRVVALERESDVQAALEVPAHVTVLVDAADRQRRGGTGERANWTLAARVASERPTILAGGLSAANVGEAWHVVRPWAIDVSSGVEDRPGVKSVDKMRALFDAVHVIADHGVASKEGA